MKAKVLNWVLLVFQLVPSAALASDVKEVRCDSFMRHGFKAPNEKGIFQFTKEPFKLTVTLTDGFQVIITDSKRFCTIDIDSEYGTPRFVAEDVSEFGWMNLVFQAERVAPNGVVLKDEIGSLQIDESRRKGRFLCRKFMDEDLKLSNCHIEN